MPIRARMPRKKLIRRKRLARPMIRRPMRSLRQPVHYFKRTQYYSGLWTNSTTSDVFNNISFILASVPGYTEFTSLYDQYRINGVKITLIPRGNQSDIGAASTTAAQSVGIFSVVDYDDTSLLTSLNQALQYQNCKMTRTHQQHSRYLKPRVEVNALSSTAPGNANVMPVRGWVDCDFPNTPHQGVKYVFQQSPNSVQTFDVKVDYYLAFKNVR